MPSNLMTTISNCSTEDKPVADLPVVLHARVVVGSGGGIDKTVVNSHRFLTNLGYHGICAFMRTPGDPGFEILEQRAAEASSPCIAIDDRGLKDISIVRRCLKVCREQNVTIWHAHDYKSNLLGLILRRFWPMRLVTTVHGWVSAEMRARMYYAVDRFCLPKYERVICVSEDLFADCRRLGVPQKNVTLIENAIDTQQYKRRITASDAKKQLGIPVNSLVIGAIGRLAREKAFDMLIRSVDQLLRERIDVHLLIAGEGNQYDELQKLVIDLGREDRIKLTGFVADTSALYQAMDVFALSSLREGLPNVVLEAMAFGVPVVATRIAGLPNIIEDGTNGFLIESGNQEELTFKTAELLADQSLRFNLGAEARATIESKYSFQKRMQRITSIYDELLAED